MLDELPHAADICKIDRNVLVITNPNLGGWELILLTPFYWFSLNNSKTVKVVTLAFFNIWYS